MASTGRNRRAIRDAFAALASIPSREVDRAMAGFTAAIADAARAAAPVESGDLRDSIATPRPRARRGVRSYAVVARSGHALAVEYGTHSMPARPSFRRACLAARARAFPLVKAALERGVKRSG